MKPPLPRQAEKELPNHLPSGPHHWAPTTSVPTQKEGAMTPIEMGRSRFLTTAPDVPQSQAPKKVHNSLFPIACPGPGGRTESLELPPDGPKSAPEKFESQQPGAVARAPFLVAHYWLLAWERHHAGEPPTWTASYPQNTPSLQRCPVRQGHLWGGGDKLPFLRTKTKSNSRGLIGKSQRPPPHTNGTGPHRYPVSGPY